jgi:hypothetical protein
LKNALAEWQYNIRLTSGQSDLVTYSVGVPIRSEEHPPLWRCPLERRDSTYAAASSIYGRDGLSSLLITLEMAAGYAQNLSKEKPTAASIVFSELDPPESENEPMRNSTTPIVNWQYKVKSMGETRLIISMSLIGPYRPSAGGKTYAYLFRVEDGGSSHEQEAVDLNALFALLSAIKIARDYAKGMMDRFGGEISYLGVLRLWPQDVELYKDEFVNIRV